MNKEKINECAKKFFELKLNSQSLDDLPKHLKPKNIDEAYLIQEELKINYLNLKDNICIGKKVGCTNKVAQKQVGINEPFYGNLFSKFSLFNNCTLNPKNFSNPYIEPEIGFIIKDDINISKYPFSIKDIDYLFKGFICSIEIVDFRFNKPINKIGIENLIATNGASDFWIKGKKIYNIKDVNFLDISVSVFVDGIKKETGNTNKVLGNPINSAIWLVNKLCQNGQILLKDNYISTGSCTKAIKLEKEAFIKANFSELENINFEYK